MNAIKEYGNKSRKARGIGGFMSGVLVLSFSTVLVKIIGLAVKIPLISVLGAEGMGYFNSAYEIYAMLCVIATAGLPTALSMVVSTSAQRGDLDGVNKAYRCALRIFLVLGAVGSGAMMLFFREIASAIGNKDAGYCILAIAPSLLLICVSSAVRGYFQGFGDMTPTAVSQLIEALGKLVFGVGFGVLAKKAGMSLSVASAASVLGITLGIFISSVYLLIAKRYKVISVEVAEHGFVKSKITQSLLKIAFPITLSSAVISSCRIADMAIILRRLQSGGFSAAEANEIYGAYTTLAVPVFSLIPSLITPISLSLIPELSAAVDGGKSDRAALVTDKAIRLTTLLAMPASMGIALYARPILSLLFSGERDAVDIAAPLLALLGMSVLFSGLITTTNAILQAYGHTVFPIISMLVGTVVKIALAYALIGDPDIGALGAPISTLACDLTVSAINLLMIGKMAPKSEKSSGIFTVYCRPLLASAVSMLTSYGVYSVLLVFTDSERLAFLPAFVCSVAVYAVAAFVFRAVEKDDLDEIPMFGRLFNMCKKRRNDKIYKDKNRGDKK